MNHWGKGQHFCAAGGIKLSRRGCSLAHGKETSAWEPCTRDLPYRGTLCCAVTGLCVHLPPFVQEGALWCNSASNIRVFVTLKHNLCSYCLVAQSCPTFCDFMDSSLLGSSVHGIAQTRILEWETISSSGESSWPRDWTHISCTGGQILYHSLPGKPETQHTWFFSCSLRKNLPISFGVMGLCIGLAKKFIKFPQTSYGKTSNEIFGQPNKKSLSPASRIVSSSYFFSFPNKIFFSLECELKDITRKREFNKKENMGTILW